MPPAGRRTNCEPNEVGRSWKGGARERADDAFFALDIKNVVAKPKLCDHVVREAGVEPARPCEHWHLKPASLPIPPLAQVVWRFVLLNARDILP